MAHDVKRYGKCERDDGYTKCGVCGRLFEAGPDTGFLYCGKICAKKKRNMDDKRRRGAA